MLRKVFAGDGRVVLFMLAVGIVIGTGLYSDIQAHEVLSSLDRAVFKIF